MNRLFFCILLIALLYSCKKEKKLINISGDCFILSDSLHFNNSSKKINFNKPPVIIKEITLNEKYFAVTSSTSSLKFKKNKCSYKDFKLIRNYNFLSRNNGFREINELSVYVKDDKEKWSRKKANEEFESIRLKDNSINLWEEIKVGLKVEELIQFISAEKYIIESNSIKFNTKEFESTFFLSKDTIKEIEVKRICL